MEARNQHVYTIVDVGRVLPRCDRPGFKPTSQVELRYWPPFLRGVGIRCLPKELDEKVAKLYSPLLGAELTVLTQEQADYIGLKVDGTSKRGRYHY